MDVEVSDERGADGTIGARLISKAVRRGIEVKRVISVIKRLFGVKLAIVNVFMLVMRGLIN